MKYSPPKQDFKFREEEFPMLEGVAPVPAKMDENVSYLAAALCPPPAVKSRPRHLYLENICP